MQEARNSSCEPYRKCERYCNDPCVYALGFPPPVVVGIRGGVLVSNVPYVGEHLKNEETC